jgi:uncharacterized protein
LGSSAESAVNAEAVIMPSTSSLRPFHVLAKPTGPICNLDCKYCFYLEKEVLYPDFGKWAMRPDVLESYICQYIEQQDTDRIQFAWQGGEPTLLGVDYFRRVVELQARFANGKHIENALQTNGVLLNDEWGHFFSEHPFLVGISIDGPRELHDTYRVDKGGQPTFDRVMRGIEILRRYSVDFNTLTTVHRANSRFPLEVYRFLRDCGSGFLQFIPIVERVATQVTQDGLVLVSPSFSDQAKVSDWSVEPLQFGNFLCTIFDEWVRNDVGKAFVQLFDVSLEMWCGMEASLCVFRPTCGSAMAIEHNGDLYSCDHFVYPENRLGNIMESPLVRLVTSPQQTQFGDAKQSTLPQYCRDCEVRFACNGECPKHRFLKTPDGEPGLNYLCTGYRKFFNHIDPYMGFMAGELKDHRPPSNVMLWARSRDRKFAAQAKIGRNDRCPCGSGSKFKHCCGRA